MEQERDTKNRRDNIANDVTTGKDVHEAEAQKPDDVDEHEDSHAYAAQLLQITWQILGGDSGIDLDTDELTFQGNPKGALICVVRVLPVWEAG